MTVPENVRVNTQVPFPAMISGTVPITISKQNGIWAIGYNYQNVAGVPNGTALANVNMLVFNTVSQTYQQASAAFLIGQPGGLLNSPVFTGNPTAPTPATGDNSQSLATTAFVANEAVRYDAAQGLSAGQQLQGANNILAVSGAGTQSLTTTQQNQAQKNAGLPAVMRSYLAGLTLSTAGSSATFSVAAGVAADSTNADMMTLASSISKTLASNWSVGNNGGGLDTGSTTANTWYHVHLIKRVDTQVVDVLFSLSASAPTMPANYTLFRRIGSMKTNGSNQWISFTQYGDDFIWASVINEINTNTPATALTTLTLVGIPPNISTRVMVRVLYNNSGAAGEVIIMSGDETVGLDGDSNARNRTIEVAVAAVAAAWQGELRANASAQIKYQSSASGTALNIQTIGYIDRRGRDT